MLDLYPSGALNLYPLGDDGIELVKSRLDDAAKGLAKELWHLPLSTGAAYALVPEGTTLERMRQFEYGGLVRRTAMYEWFSHHVLNLNSRNKDGVLIFQDAWGARPCDPHLQERKSRMFFDATDVHYFVPSEEIETETIIQASKDLRGFRELGSFVTTTKKLNDQVLDKSELQLLAANVLEIYVDSYDAESFVIWKKSN